MVGIERYLNKRFSFIVFFSDGVQFYLIAPDLNGRTDFIKFLPFFDTLLLKVL